MFCLHVILINALHLFVVMGYMDMKFGYHIIEGKAKYFESIEVNLEKNTVQIHTPAHNDIMESYQFQDFHQGQQMKCFPSLMQCRLRDIDKTNAVDAGQITEAFVHSWNIGDNTINNANENIVTEMYYAIFDNSNDDIILRGPLQEFHQNFKYPVYKEKKLPLDAEVYNITRAAGGRVKRTVHSIGDPCNGRPPRIIFAMPTEGSCNHFKICKSKERRNGQWIMTDCGNTQIHSPVMFQCLCCPSSSSFTVESGGCMCLNEVWFDIFD